MATITIPKEDYFNYAPIKIAELAGQPNPDKIFYDRDNEKFYVEDVTQRSLYTAFRTYLKTFDEHDLLNIKEISKIDIDITAEKSRKKYLTLETGQLLAYIYKENEAAKYKAARYPTIDDTSTPYPWIKSEMDATGQTGQEAANAILARSDVWLTKGPQIEKERRIGKINIDAATNEAEVNTARNKAIAALELI